MKLFKCSKCGKELAQHDKCAVIWCCDGWMEVIDKNYKKQVSSPDIIFKGSGWPSKDLKEGK